MKPCPKNRERIVWLAMDPLAIRHEQELRAHLDTCAGCRRYLEEISSVAAGLRAAEPESRSRPSASFHRNLASALTAAERPSAGETLWANVSSLWNWRLALPAAVALALGIAAWLVAGRRAQVPPPAPLALHALATPALKSGWEPTFSNYEMAAHQSLDKLDELLTEQGNKNPAAPAVCLTARLPRLNLDD
jgi:anti-sigma-K factor RskA